MDQARREAEGSKLGVDDDPGEGAEVRVEECGFAVAWEGVEVEGVVAGGGVEGGVGEDGDGDGSGVRVGTREVAHDPDARPGGGAALPVVEALQFAEVLDGPAVEEERAG
jgi:hypothetical protein